MAKTVQFKKKPVKSADTEQKLDAWLEEKTAPESPAQPVTVEETEQGGAAMEAHDAPETAPAAVKPKRADKPKRQKISFESQEEDIAIAQVTFHMPKTLQRRLKLECFRQDKTIKDYVIELLDKKLPKDAAF